MKIDQKQVNVEAIVLRHAEFGEADRLLVLLTKYHGKIRAIAKGVRKIKSRKAGHLEPLTKTKLQLSKGKNFWIINQAESINAHLKIRSDLLFTAYGLYILELADRFTTEEGENEAIYNIVSNALLRLEKGYQAENIIHFFEINLLNILGYKPELHYCVHCREEIVPVDQFFSFYDGGVICPRCGTNAYSVIPVDVETLRYLRHFQRSPYKDIGGIKISQSVQNNLEKLLQNYFSFLLERKINSVSFIREARNSNSYTINHA